VTVAGTGEPEFTNSANNTQWFQWTNAGPYRVEFNHSVDGGAAVVDGPYAVAQTGTTNVNWTGISGVSAPLEEGRKYTICGYGRWQDAYGMWYGDFSTSCGTAGAKRTSTTIDRTKPVITLAAAATTRQLAVPVAISYEDALAHPFGVAFLSTDGAAYTELPGCAPADPGNRKTTFACTVTLPDADGAHQVCAIVPDAAVPDNPTSADQRGTATQANRSDPKCTPVVLDRVAPQVLVSGPSQLAVGQVGEFAAAATDATSGVASASAGWAWADGATSKGVDTAHAFAAPGTYRVTFTVADAAGNVAQAAKDVEVVAPASPAPAPAPAPPASGEPPVAQPAPAPALAVRVQGVRRVRGGRRVLHIAVTGASGSARVTLRRGRRVVAYGKRAIADGLLTLPLPRKLVAGRHVVEVAAGAAAATAKIRLSGRKPAAVRATGARAVIDPRGLELRLP
jgi:hypothetical protein